MNIIYNILSSLLLLTSTSAAHHLIDIDSITKHINVYREMHQAPRVEYSQEISDFSKSWADYMANNRKFEHSGVDMYGENIAMIPVNKDHIDYTDAIIQSIDLFYDEVELYDFNNPGFDGKTGHFTQLVWVNTKRIGFSASTSSNGYIYVCTNYDPPGNYYGDFERNVKPAIQLASPPPKPITSPIQIMRPPPLVPPPDYVEPPLSIPPDYVDPPLVISPQTPYSPPDYVEPPPMVQPMVPPINMLPSPPNSPSYTLTIKYPGSNQTYVETVLCPSLMTIFSNSGCRIQLVSSTGIYYGGRMFNVEYSTLCQTIAFDIANFTKRGKIACNSTIAVHLNGDDMFRYRASSLTCI
jgi:hypothetical protein